MGSGGQRDIRNHRRRVAGGEGEQPLVANVDLVLAVCGLDRPVRKGRIERTVTLALDAGAETVVVLTKADKLTRAEQTKALSIARLQTGGGEVRMFSALKKQGVDEAALLLWQWAHPQAEAGAVVPAAPAG